HRTLHSFPTRRSSDLKGFTYIYRYFFFLPSVIWCKHKYWTIPPNRCMVPRPQGISMNHLSFNNVTLCLYWTPHLWTFNILVWWRSEEHTSELQSRENL